MIQPLQSPSAPPLSGPRRVLQARQPDLSAVTERAAAAPVGRFDIPAEVLLVMQRIADRDGGCAEAMAVHLHHRLSALDRRSVAGSAFSETRACCQAHLEVVARVAAKGGATAAIVIPDPAIEHARSLIRRGVSLDVLLRTYHLGQAFLSAEAATRLEEQALDDGLRLRATIAVDAFLFEYIDRVSEAMAAIYGDERDSWHRSPEAVRAEALREIMGGRGVDGRRLERRLGYDLTGHHMAFVLAAGDRDCSFETLRGEARRIAAAAGANGSLVVPGEGMSVWAWYRSVDDLTECTERLQAEWRPADGVRVAFADPALGVDGFRASHLDAIEAIEFVERFPAMISPRGTVSYRSVELVSLLTQDPERAARFMRSRLGPLAADDQRHRDLRTTALGFLRHNRSHARAGEALFLHKNTIFTRVKHVEKLLGVRSGSWGVELETALLLASIFEGAAVD